MSNTTERERRRTAGNRLKRLLEQQEDPDDEFYGTAYGGFLDEEEDNDYRSEESEEDVVDSDFDQDDQEQQEENDENQSDSTKKRQTKDDNGESDDEDGETSRRRKKKIVYQAKSLQQDLKAQKREEQEQTSETRQTRLQEKKASVPKTEAKTLRKSTSVKRVELEKRQQERQERRTYLKGIASIRNTGEVRRLTQEELLEEAKITEEINIESLEAYQQIEMKKKETKRMKLIQECPRICTSSMTIVNEPNDQWNDLLDGQSISERCSRTFISFTHVQTYNDLCSTLNSSEHCHRRRLCPITGMPAQYFDPLTRMPYANIEAFQILRRIYHEELKRSKRSTPSVLIDAQRDVNLNNLR